MNFCTIQNLIWHLYNKINYKTGNYLYKFTLKIMKLKIGLLELAEQLGNVSAACKTMGYSRDSYYRFQELYENREKEVSTGNDSKKPLMSNRVIAK